MVRVVLRWAGVIQSAQHRQHVRLMDSCITQLKAQGPSRTCNESKEEEEEDSMWRWCVWFEEGWLCVRSQEDWLWGIGR